MPANSPERGLEAERRGASEAGGRGEPPRRCGHFPGAAAAFQEPSANLRSGGRCLRSPRPACMSSLQRPMAASGPASAAPLSAEQAKVVLAEVLKAFGAPENAQRLDEARDNACNDMGKMLQFLLPVATQIQQDVIKAYGFSSDGEGVLKFARLIKSYESQDPEIASMSGKLKAMFLPPMTLPPHGSGTGGVAAS
ncbi:protein C10 [Alligator mississippiensis]|uniref:protein C10 n=1 Tax=Alligator mississippiensis TaxID=8496 RepID=UPI00090761FB|nr:protein C10 [Alligator mississippiensis]